LGNYSKARDAYQHSLTITPANDVVQKRLNLCERVLAMDPTDRNLNTATRYQHSQALLSGALDQIMRCSGGTDATLPEGVRTNVDNAKKAIGHREKSRSLSDAVEEDVTLAQQLWAARPASCSASGDEVDALRRVMAKLPTRPHEQGPSN
jgi:hypothetical protein